MNILLILAHPGQHSFNHALAETAIRTLEVQGHHIIFHDLYSENFESLATVGAIPGLAQPDPVIARHCQDLKNSDGIIIIHPNWWGQPPAILKDWIDKVILPGIAYEFNEDDKGDGVPIGLLKAKVAIVFNTSNTSAQREKNVFLDPLETIWKNCIFDFCGVKQFERRVFRVMVTSNPQERKQWLDEARTMLLRHFT